MQNPIKPFQKQKGAALIIMAFIIGLAVIAYLLHGLDPARLRGEQDKKNAFILMQSKDAIISYSISRAVSGERPGDMPRPDSFATTEAPNYNYDGDTDGGCLNSASATGLPQINSGANMRCLGRLPWRTIGMSIPQATQNDPIGNMPWYAVSANLVDSTCLKELNSNILNQIYTGYVCNGVTLPHPWLTVRDSSGNIVSNRVAVVLMMPNSALTGQLRPTAPLNPVANYLDAITVPVGCAVPCVPGVYSNAGLNNEYILFNQASSANIANDQLVYITIDELIRAVERRATQEAAKQLKKYYVNSSALPANRFYPYAATLGDVNNACVDANLAGFISVRPASANCTSVTSCSVSFPMTEVEFELASGNYTSRTGSCSRAANICTCNGIGSCNKSSAPASSFSCNAAGVCQSVGTNPAGFFTFNYVPETPDVTVISGACAIFVLGQVICNDVGTFSSPLSNCAHANPGLSTLPAWFTDNNWQEHIYYAISNNCSAASTGCAAANLTVGTQNNVHAVVISSGVALPATEAKPAGQFPPSGDPKDYLDSLINTDGGTPSYPANIIFDATSKMKSNNYNDQPLIVAP